ncbi:hypothetical protein BD410DRAFT_785645 [Rickenella mellea]|uniref:Mitochondrial import inner membrane translocase subunit TIM54 n=1 Tax=Rickenella mellea TaxID=50990 RepID=A0A4Y7QCU0_9AGAM|nr:hypothetical protein BD410DRAFT_785645 [Rickenella mellea]
MSSQPAGPSTPPPPPQPGYYAALRYTGIPASWIRRPKLPSRNWLIFLSLTSSVLGLYTYDRRKCKQIRQQYVDRVKYLAEQPLQSWDLPRKVTVYSAKWPGDDDYNRCVQYFRKYVKPILVAAAVDYEIVNGKRHGDLAGIITDRIKSRRRSELGLDPPPNVMIPLSKKETPEQRMQRELRGGSVIIGRNTLKEYMRGLKAGWTESLEKVDREDGLSRELDGDGHFDEPELADPSASIDGEPIPTKSRLMPSKSTALFSPLKMGAPPPSTMSTPIPAAANAPPDNIPPQPPLLLVPFINYLGIKQIPLMIWDFFNQRKKVQAGAEAAYTLIEGQQRPIIPPSSPSSPESELSPPPTASHSDLDFDREAEWYYKNSLKKFSSEIDDARKEYYKALPKKLETARALSRGTREPTKDEKNFPPPTEVELRAERMKKELRWRGDLAGWEIVRPESEVAWDDRFRGSLSIFTQRHGDEPDSKSE